MEWIAEHVALTQAVVASVSALVWVVYLQLFLMSYLRQRRSEILINRGAGVGLDARCYIANLGFEPIYVSQLLMSLKTPEGDVDAAITDRVVLTEEQMNDPGHATNQGPLKSSESFDAGSFNELMERALQVRGKDEDTEVESLEITVVALHASSAAYVGATRRYDIIQRDGYRDILPDSLRTRQIRSVLACRRLKRKLQRDLSWYRS